ncbi:MAG TPA: hypothetical protein VFZ08_06615, partial [Terriglobia bacterium]|nr:hypothetical protein [Terriglobia bacterium]
VLNGGGFLNSPDGDSIPNVRIIVSPGRIIVLNQHETTLAEIPIRELREIVMEPAAPEVRSKKRNPARRLRIRWESPEIHVAHFCYDGFFAEHLAGIAERTLRSVWKKELPVLPS